MTATRQNQIDEANRLCALECDKLEKIIGKEQVHCETIHEGISLFKFECFFSNEDNKSTRRIVKIKVKK